MKVLQVGIGGMGNVWINAVLNTPEVEYAGFVEINPQIADEQAARYGLDRALVFETLSDALAAVHPDGVIDVTPPPFHKDVSITSLRAGVPVLSEKPLAPSIEEAQAIVSAANETGVLHMVAQNYRYSPPAQTLKAVLDSGEMGALSAVTVSFFKGPHFGGFRDEMDYPLIVDMAIHHFDMLRFFLGADPISVYGRSWNPPWSWYRGDASASVSFEFPGAVFVSYNGSWCSQGRETPWNANWRFECERGVVELVEDQVVVHRLLGVEERGGYRHVQNAAPQIVEPVAMPYVAQTYLLREFYQAVTQGTTPATSCQDNFRSLAMVFNVIESFRTGEVIR